jgi:DNA-binding beta-propeller fold protein YncE
MALVIEMTSITQISAFTSSALSDYDILVTSAAYAEGAIKDGVFRFDPDSGEYLGTFGYGAKIIDPRGIRLSPKADRIVVNNGDDRLLVFDALTGQYVDELARLPGLNPGGCKFGSDGRYYVGSRSMRSILVFDVTNRDVPQTFVPGTFVKFPRGLAAAPDGSVYFASGTDPSTRDGQNTVLRFLRDGRLDHSFRVVDPELSPTDLEMSPTGSLLAASEFPFKDPDAMTTIREYDQGSGRLVRVFDAGRDESGRRITTNPRGITIGPDGHLYSSGRDNIVRYDLAAGTLERVVVSSPGIHVQSVIFVPKIRPRPVPTRT